MYQFYLSKEDEKIKFYSDLMYPLYLSNIFEEYEGEKFINILERKEVIQNLKNFTRPLVKNVIKDKLKSILNELEGFYLTEKDIKLNSKTLIEEKISISLPKLVDYYINGLEKKFLKEIEYQQKIEKLLKNFLVNLKKLNN